MLITMRGGATQGRSDRGRGQEIGGRSSRRGRGAGANTTPSRMDELLSPGILENGLEIHEFGLVGQEAAELLTAKHGKTVSWSCYIDIFSMADRTYVKRTYCRVSGELYGM